MKKLLRRIQESFTIETVHAHCDIPCGIYEPSDAITAAQTCIRMLDLIKELPMQGLSETDQQNAFVRYVKVKEDHAERCKHSVRVIWGDYFKDEHLKLVPDLHELVWKIMRQASKVRQSTDPQAGHDLLESVNAFAQAYWRTREMPSQTVEAPNPTKTPTVLPVLS